MSKTDLKKVNWTPVIDSIVNKHGYMAALVFGAIWRHCQMSGKACTASLDTIAKMIGVERKTIMRYADILADDGYITRFKTSGKPTTYRDTGKAGIKVEVMAYDEINDTHDSDGQVEEETSPSEGLHQSHTGTAPVPLRDLNNSIKDSIKDTADIQKAECPRAQKKGDIIDGMLHYCKGNNDNIINTYPEEVRETLRTFIKYWPVDIPEKTKRQNGKWAQWLNELRDINKACAEFGLVIIPYAYEEYNKHPWIVDHPGATIKAIRSVVANKRKEKDYTGKVEY